MSEEQNLLLKEKFKKLSNYVPKIGVFGKTGAGKSSLCNAIFGRDVAKISDVEACTREPQNIVVSSESGGIILIDVPRVGESPERDKEYSELYKSLLPELDIVLWVIKADDRALSVDQDIYTKCVKDYEDKTPTVFILNQIDKLEPIQEWNEDEKQPGPRQAHNITQKKNDVGRIFGINPSHIGAVSAAEGFGLTDLLDQIVTAVPAKKKYGVVREAKKENVSEEIMIKAKKGFFEALWDEVVDLAKTIANMVTYEAADKVFEILKKKLNV